MEKLSRGESPLLPEQLVYRGEFGIEVVSFIPFVYTLWVEGLLGSRRISTYAGMRPYYYFLPEDQVHERPAELREWLSPAERWWPGNDEHVRMRIPGESYPDYAVRYAPVGESDRPSLFIQNKFCIEFGRGPINYLPLEGLAYLFENTQEHWRILYARQGVDASVTPSYAADSNLALPFPDGELCERYPHVDVIDLRAHGADYNSAKLEAMAGASALLGVQGGATHAFSYFDVPTLIWHQKGAEDRFSYWHGHYQYMTERTTPLWVTDRTVALKSFTWLLRAMVVKPEGDSERRHRQALDEWTEDFRSRRAVL